jgi:hypothetical protein
VGVRQDGTVGVRQERGGEAELHRVAANRNGREGDIQSSGPEAAGEVPARLALGTSRLVASRPMTAMARLDNAKTTEPPVRATTDTATTSNPKMAADAPALALKKFV